MPSAVASLDKLESRVALSKSSHLIVLVVSNTVEYFDERVCTNALTTTLEFAQPYSAAREELYCPMGHPWYNL